ncbi:helix-turn-helix domain-containing protein [Acetobacteraceae bacterium KSS8]|uniref:Helix-turn-helix domain-containing protein n=1 Tax=Endosaccharibacter trunci TaxID=2812733 RepID=A0ABT1W7Z4_9PROT|nr:helix-turn-helix domain-containing protein [Acetobacteraceae bacterium KSS8]
MSHAPALTDREMTAIGKALADPRRFRMLREIAVAGTLCCQEMRATHPVSAATISHHMKELEAAGLVEIVRQGKFALLRFRQDTMQRYLGQLTGAFGAPLESCDD